VFRNKIELNLRMQLRTYIYAARLCSYAPDVSEITKPTTVVATALFVFVFFD